MKKHRPNRTPLRPDPDLTWPDFLFSRVSGDLTSPVRRCALDILHLSWSKGRLLHCCNGLWFGDSQLNHPLCGLIFINHAGLERLHIVQNCMKVLIHDVECCLKTIVLISVNYYCESRVHAALMANQVYSLCGMKYVICYFYLFIFWKRCLRVFCSLRLSLRFLFIYWFGAK